MSDTSPPEEQSTSGRRSGRAAIGVAIGLAVVLAPLLIVALGHGEATKQDRRIVQADALAAVRSAVGRTAAASGYEMDTVSTSSQPSGGPCRVIVGPNASATQATRPICVTAPPQTFQFTSHSIVNLEPYAMVSITSSSSFGAVTLHVNSERAWQLGAATAGYTPGTPGVVLSDYSSQVVGTLGRGPGALSMISLASRGGYLNLEEEAIATAKPAGTGTVGDVPVTYYDVTIDITKLADAPNLSDVQRQTITAALPLLEQSGYAGTTERIGVDDQGYAREITATTNFDDGSSTERHSVLSNFGCAPKVYMPNETQPPDTTNPPCAPDSTTAAPSSSAAPATSPSSTTTTSSKLPITTSSRPDGPAMQVPVQVLNGSGIQGVATARTNELRALGWPVVPPGNAPAQRTGTAVECRAGLDLAAAQLVDVLARIGVTASLEPIPTPVPDGYDATASCYVILGR